MHLFCSSHNALEKYPWSMTPYAHQKHEMRYFVLQYANAVESFETTSSQ